VEGLPFSGLVQMAPIPLVAYIWQWQEHRRLPSFIWLET